MTGRGSRFAAFHVRDAVLPTTDGGAILARFRATTVALPARGADVPTTGGGAFLPVDVAGAVLPTTGDAATPARSLVRGDAGLAHAADRTDAANVQDPFPASRVFLAIPVHAADDQNYREYHAIPGNFCDGHHGKQLQRCRYCRPIAAG